MLLKLLYFCKMSKPKFVQPSLTFTQELKKRINEYFESNKVEKTGNHKLFSKAIILGLSLIGVYVHLVFFTPPVAIALLECVLLAVVVSSIGFNIMHDGGHGSFSNNKVLNKIAAHSLDLLGGSSYMWHMKHNIIHHTYTNVEGVDDDINVEPWLRFHTSQKKRKLHKYQHYYFWVFYSLLYFSWIFIGDFKKYFTKKIGEIEIQKMKGEDHFSFWMSKVSFVGIFMIIPIIVVGFKPWLLGFAIFLLSTGLLISMVFQLAHTVEEANFVKAIASETSDADIIENEWTIHQLETTANFATNNRVVNWFTGGLNFQVEHHLFPKISHVHYPAISKIIKEVCSVYDVRYNEFKRTRDAIYSHLRYLRLMGAVA
jgi:linoleoyl-CoA desaturase